MKDAAEIALDEIAAMCGVPEWDYPGQVTRDVEMLRGCLQKLVSTSRTVTAFGSEVAIGEFTVALTQAEQLLALRK